MPLTKQQLKAYIESGEATPIPISWAGVRYWRSRSVSSLGCPG